MPSAVVFRVWRRTEDDVLREWYYRLTARGARSFVRECIIAGVPVWVSPPLTTASRPPSGADDAR